MKRMFTLAVLALCSGVWAAGVRYSIGIDANAGTGAWNRFYERCVGTCHPTTILTSAYGGRNIMNALRRGREECGFQMVRGHGVFGRDIGIYSEVNGVPTYDWTKFDQIYDSIVAIGMKAVIEFSFMPNQLASGSQTMFWYNGAPGNVTPPRDYNKWRDLCKNVVLHMQQRYGAREIRDNWYFEVWNEPDLGVFWSSDRAAYFKTYDYASEGVREADPLCRVGGPSISGCSPLWMDQFLNHTKNGTNYATGQKGSKVDFITYHHYANDPPYGSLPSGVSIPQSQNAYHKAMCDFAKKYSFTGEIHNTEWAPSYAIQNEHSDDESAASFVAKTIHLLMDNGSGYPMPNAYSWWVISDIFEEWNAGDRTAFDGSFGLLVRGDANIPDSWDVEKPPFNTFKLLHRMTDTRLTVTGGVTTDGVNGIATMSSDGKSLQVLVYNHTNGGKANSALADSVTLTIDNIPFAPGNVKVEQWLIDRNTSNGFRKWQSLGSPARPNAAQWKQIKDAAQLAAMEPSAVVSLANKQFTKKFPLNTYGVTLLNLTSASGVSAMPDARMSAGRARPSFRFQGSDLVVDMAGTGLREVAVFDMHGRCALRAGAQGRIRGDAAGLAPGAYVLVADNRDGSHRVPLVVR